MFRNIVLLLVVISVQTLNVAGYSWRNWNGTVPHDAVIGAVDGRGASYIAKAWLPNLGLYIGQVFAGQTEVPVSYYAAGPGSVNSSTTIEVLCSDNNDVVWIGSNTRLTSTILQDRLQYPVLGGRTSYYNSNIVYIGKYVETNGKVYIGSVHTDYYVYFVSENGTATYSNYYELLITTENVSSQYIDSYDTFVDNNSSKLPSYPKTH